MSWSDSEDPYEDGKAKKNYRKPRNNDIDDEDGVDHRQKRSSKRSHRRKTHKDELWEEHQRHDPPDSRRIRSKPFSAAPGR